MKDFQADAFTTVRSRRLTAERKQNELLTRLRADSEFSELENARDSISFEIARLRSLNKDFGHLNDKYLQAKKMFENKLNSLGLTEADLEPQYFCKLCNDTGTHNGVTCDCVKQLVYTELRSGCKGLPSDVVDFENVDYSIYAEDERNGYKKLYSLLHNYALNFPPQKRNILFLHGAVGTGKTYAAAVTANALMERGFSVFFINAQQLNAVFLKYHLAQLSDKEAIFSPLTDADLLVVDDLGTESVYNNVTVNYLYQLICERVNSPMIFTSNLSPKDVEIRYGQRISSRLADKNSSFVINVTGKDLRAN